MKSNRLYLSLLLLFPLALQADPYAYLANQGRDEVDVIDTTTNSYVTHIPIPTAGSSSDLAFPICIAIAPNGTTVCTANVYGNSGTADVTASLIDATLSIPTMINTIQVTNSSSALVTYNPNGIAYTTDSNSVYITTMPNSPSTGTGTVYSITDITGTQTVTQVTTAIIAPTAIAIGNTPSQTAYIGTNGSGIYYMSIPGNTPVPIPNTGDSNTETLSIAVYGNTVYAVSIDGGTGILYQIVGNAVIQTINLGSGAPTGIVVSPDGNYLYITNNDMGEIVVIPTIDLSSSATFPSADAIALAITPDSKELFVTNEIAEVSPYFVPAGTSAGSTLSYGGGAGRSSIVIASPLSSPASPSSVSGCKTSNVFLLQTDYINNITWTAPASGAPAAYAIYRDATLTQLVAMVPATSPLQYYDHGRNPSVTYSYYIVSVDASGNQSAATSVTVTQNC